MASALFSIKPDYAQAILDGTKCFEFRTKRCKKEIDLIVIYATSPVCKVLGEVAVSGILEDSPKELWSKTQAFAGIKYADYMKYFEGRDHAIAYCLSFPRRYGRPASLKDLGVAAAPQSYLYLADR